jgi:hypothetical protein
MSKNQTILSLTTHERLAHFARIAQNWSAEDLRLTPPDWQFLDSRAHIEIWEVIRSR